MGDNIFASVEDFAERLGRITSAMSALPDSSEITQTNGPAGGVSSQFSIDLARAARSLGVEIKKIGFELTGLGTAIRQTSDDLIAQDAAVEGDLNRLLGFIDSAAPTTPVTPGSGTGRNAEIV